MDAVVPIECHTHVLLSEQVNIGILPRFGGLRTDQPSLSLPYLLIAHHTDGNLGFIIWFTRPPDESTTTMWLLPALTPAH